MNHDDRMALAERLEDRIDILNRNLANVTENTRPQKRELRRRYIKGRIREARKLKEKLSEDKLDEYIQYRGAGFEEEPGD